MTDYTYEQNSATYTPWNQMKKRLISPGVFKPLYLKECEQGTNTSFKLDPRSASMWISLHRDNMMCSYDAIGIDNRTGIPYQSNNLRSLGSVFGDKEITNGRFYWEVYVGNALEYSVGVAYKQVPRNTNLGENSQSWVVRKFKSRPNLYAMTMGRVEQQISNEPEILGLLFDYERGILSFYDAESKKHLYSFYSSFSEPCLPAFSIGQGGWMELRALDPAKATYTGVANRPRSHYVRREEKPLSVTWAPERPRHFNASPPKWQPPHAEKNWDGSWKIQRIKSAQVNSTRLQYPKYH
jgi:hypothetical protein